MYYIPNHTVKEQIEKVKETFVKVKYKVKLPKTPKKFRTRFVNLYKQL